MRFSIVADILEQLEKTSSHLAMRDLLAKFLKKTPASEIRIVSYLVLGKIGAEYDSKILGMASQMVIKAIRLTHEQQFSVN